MMTKLFIGPMSRNIIDTCIQFVNQENISLGLIPSRRQIDFDSGYVGFTTSEFVTYVLQRTNNVNNIILERDHAGPFQGRNTDDGIQSIIEDITSGFHIIHLDPFKKFLDIKKAAQWTAKTIRSLDTVSVRFEIGTESAIRPYTVNELGEFLAIVQKNISIKTFKEVVEYIVIQSGTEIDGLRNKNTFNEDKSKIMINLVHAMGFKAKEHNGDFLSNKDLKKRFSLGLDAINIAPEFGILETNVVLKHVHPGTKIQLLKFFVDSYKWSKWLPDSASYLEKALFAGHYNFNDDRYKIIMKDFPEVQTIIRQEIYNRLKDLHLSCSV